MPKELYEIRRFNLGIVSSPSETDIPVDAASFSLDVDPIIEGGKLGGMPGHTEIKDGAGTPASIIVDQFSFVEDLDGDSTLIGFDHSDNRIKYVRDIDGTPGAATTITSSLATDSNEVCIAQHGKELHVGCGPDSKAQWVGFNQQGQFGGSAPTAPIAEDAELLSIYNTVSTSGGLGLHKVLRIEAATVGVKFVAIEWGGTSILGFNSTTGSDYSPYTFSGTQLTFTRLQAMCKDRTSSSYFWVYDRDDTEYGTLYRINMSTSGVLTVNKAMEVAGWGTAGLEDPSAYTVSDIITDNGTSEKYMYFAMYDRGGGVPIVGNRSQDPNDVRPIDEEYSVGYPTLIFRSAGKSTAMVNGVAFTTINVTPNLDATDESQASDGKLRLENDVDNTFHRFDLITLKKPFVNIAEQGETYDNWIGWFCAFKSRTSDPKINVASSGGWTRIGIVCFAMNDSAVAGSGHLPNTTSCRLLSVPDESSEILYYDSFPTSFQATLVRNTPYFYLVASNTGNAMSVRAYSTAEAESELAEASWYDTNSLRFFHSLDGSSVPEDTLSIQAENIVMCDMGGAAVSATSEVPFFSEYGGLVKGLFEFTYDAGPPASITLDSTQVLDVSDFIVTTSESNERADGVRSGDTFEYYVALEYDGYQVGPLGSRVASRRISKDGIAINLAFRIQEDVITGISTRITGIYVLRARSSSLTGELMSIPRVIGRIDLVESPQSTEYKGVTGYATYRMIDYNTPGETFEQLAGYDSSDTSCTPNYGLCCVGEDRLMVGNCGGVDAFADATNIVFISQPGKYDQFNLTTDYIILSERPVAMSYWRGRFYVFSQNRVWRINPNGPFIEDDFEGIGCDGPSSVIANEWGMFVAGKNGIFLDSGSGFVSIGDAILHSEPDTPQDFGWLGRNTTYAPIVFFDPVRKAFCASLKFGSFTNSYVYAYTVPQRRWDLWSLTTGVLLTDAKGGPSSTLYGCDGAKLYSMFSNTASRRSYSWYSKVFDMGYATEYKKFYEVRGKYSGTNAATCELNNEDGDTLSKTATVGDGFCVFKIAAADRKQRGIKFQIQNQAGNVLIDAVSIQFRRLSGTH